MRSQRQIHSDKCWIDDLQVCKQSGVGLSTNQIYREDDNRQEEHPFEDRNFHFKFDNNSSLYGVFDGHEGCRAVEFCIQRLPAEILLGQLNERMSDEEIKEVLRQAFITVEKGFMDSIDDLLAERVSFEIPDGVMPYELYQQAPQVIDKINRINSEVASGASAAIALIYNGKLFVANVGSCRVLLCQTDANSVLKVVQLSTDHELTNEDELLRLSQLGINTDVIRKYSHIGNQQNTRCLGNYMVKGGYKEVEQLAMASQEPVIAEPDIIGGINLDESYRFLLLMTAGLYKSIEDETGTDEVNKYIAQCVVEQFKEQATITGVAQGVVNKIVRLHHDWYMTSSLSNSSSTKREDITLVLRNFNFPMPNAITSPTALSVTFNPLISSRIISNTLTNSSQYMSSITESNLTDTNTSSSSDMSRITNNNPEERIAAYVNFDEFYRNFETAKANGTLPDGLEI